MLFSCLIIFFAFIINFSRIRRNVMFPMTHPATFTKNARIFFLLLLFLAIDPSVVKAQWGPNNSIKYLYVPYSDQEGSLFFPRKDPEEQEISLGPVVVRPGIGVSETYRTNLTLSEDNQKEDFFTSLFPALQFTLPYKRHRFGIEYLGDFVWYSKNPRFDTNNHYFFGFAQFSFFKDLRLSVENFTGLLHTPVEDTVDQETLENQQDPAFISQFKRRIPYHNYGSHVSIDKKFGNQFDFRVDYDSRIQRFQNTRDQNDNFISNAPGISAGYLLFRKTRFLLGYIFEDWAGDRSTPTSSVTHTQHQLVYGIEWHHHSDILLDAKGTYNWLEYPNPGFSSQYWGANLHFRYSRFRRIILDLLFSRTTYPTFFYTGEKLEQPSSSYSFENQGSLSMAYKFRENFLAWINFSYRNVVYKNSLGTERDRIDNLYGGTLQFIYELRPWLRMGLTGGYSKGESNFDGESFSDQVFQFYVQGAF